MGERRLKSHNVRINNNRLSDAYGLYLDIRACLSVYNPSGAIYNNCIARRLADFCDERICVMAKSMIDEIRLAEQTAAKTVNDAQAAAQSKIDSAKSQAQALSHEMIAEAKRNSCPIKLNFSVQDIFDLPDTSQTFDVVIVANALHIVQQPKKALAEIRRVLKDDGGTL